MGYGNPTFPYQIIDCYRPQCNHKNITHKQSFAIISSNHLCCRGCHIAEFCTQCRSNHHFGPCNQIDEASDAVILAGTKPCPTCSSRVEKNGGCQHMTCRCGTHFCWTCLQVYQPNQISEHYVGLNVFTGACRGIIQPEP